LNTKIYLQSDKIRNKKEETHCLTIYLQQWCHANNFRCNADFLWKC